MTALLIATSLFIHDSHMLGVIDLFLYFTALTRPAINGKCQFCELASMTIERHRSITRLASIYFIYPTVTRVLLWLIWVTGSYTHSQKSAYIPATPYAI